MRDIVILIFGLPIAAVAGGMLGRWGCRRILKLHLPYSERVKGLNQ